MTAREEWANSGWGCCCVAVAAAGKGGGGGEELNDVLSRGLPPTPPPFCNVRIFFDSPKKAPKAFTPTLLSP